MPPSPRHFPSSYLPATTRPSAGAEAESREVRGVDDVLTGGTAPRGTTETNPRVAWLETYVTVLRFGYPRRVSSREDPRLGRTLGGRYRVEKLLAKGGMGAVYEAENVSIGRRVAVKVLHAHYAQDD